MTSKKLKALGQLILFIVGIELIGGLSGGVFIIILNSHP